MDVTNIYFYAEGYYSGKTYAENVIVPTPSLHGMESDIAALKLYVSDLDGKHSEVLGEVGLQHFTEEEAEDMEWAVDNDGDMLYEALKKVFAAHGKDLDMEIDAAECFVQSLNSFVEIPVRVRKSQVETVREFCRNL